MAYVTVLQSKIKEEKRASVLSSRKNTAERRHGAFLSKPDDGTIWKDDQDFEGPIPARDAEDFSSESLGG